MTIWPFIFVRRECTMDDVDINHERIHMRQQMEMLVIPFLLWYIIEWLLRSIFGTGNAYRNISFEREAYAYEKNMEYLTWRKFWAWIRFLRKNK